jgi:hypothetical protein
MTEKKRLDKIFTHDNLPPLFGENFSPGKHDWKRLSGIEFERIGRILTCHLLIEHHINKFIELRTPKEFDWDESRLTFSQKLKLVKKDHPFQKYKFIKGIEIINKIRNTYSHTLEVSIDEKDIHIINEILIAIREKHPSKDGEEYEHTALATIEALTSLFCAYFAGYCSSLIDQTHKLPSALREPAREPSEKQNGTQHQL